MACGTLKVRVQKFSLSAETRNIRYILCCTAAHPFVGEMMHGGRNDGCRCVCVTQIGLFIRYKSNINIALVTARLPCALSPSVCQCENHRMGEEPSSDQSSALCWTLDISNKTRIQIK